MIKGKARCQSIAPPTKTSVPFARSILDQWKFYGERKEVAKNLRENSRLYPRGKLFGTVAYSRIQKLQLDQ